MKHFEVLRFQVLVRVLAHDLQELVRRERLDVREDLVHGNRRELLDQVRGLPLRLEVLGVGQCDENGPGSEESTQASKL